MEIRWLPDTLALSEALRELAATTWADRPPHVFNGSVLIHQQTHLTTDKIILEGIFTDYQFYYAQKKTATDFGIRPIAVSGLLLCENHIILGRRSPQVTSYPGWWELAPSGAIDQAMAQPDGTVEFIRQLREEFTEEILLPASAIDAILPFGVFLDPSDPVYDVLSEIRVNVTCQAILDAMQSADEYAEAVAVPIVEIKAWLAAHQTDLIPPSQAALHVWMQNHARSHP